MQEQEVRQRRKGAVAGMIDKEPFDAEKTVTEAKPLKKRTRRKDGLITAEEQVANSTFVLRNYQFPELQVEFRSQVKHWTVERYYPHAEGGPMAFESPDSDADDYRFYLLKQKILRKAGVNYAVVRKYRGLSDTIQDLAEQIDGKDLLDEQKVKK